MKDRRQTPKIKQKSTKNEEKSKGLVVIPYIEGLTERLSRVYKKHGFSTAMKPYITLRRMLVHPKDKRDPLQTADSVYEIPCKSCSKTYIGETGRIFKTRLSEHQKEAAKTKCQKFHQITKENIIFWDFQIGHNWARRDQQSHHQLGRRQNYRSRIWQNHTLAERSHLDQKQGQRHYE